MSQHTYLCIDLKSFYASVECVARGLDPFQVNLVVADPTRGRGALCLAVSPALKALGVRNRCRLFEIPPGIPYLTAMPRMKKYLEVSASIYALYLQYFAKEDLYPYSIDECFLDLTPYRELYGKSGEEIAHSLMQAVYEKTGICATAGVGPNLFLAKIAMDILAKHRDSHIGVLDDESFRRLMWHHRPITDIWQIGPGIARRLSRYGISDLYGITRVSPRLLYREFGKNAESLIQHAHGCDPCTMADIHSYHPREQSLSSGQVLFHDADYDEALLLVEEMAEILIQDLAVKELAVHGVSLCVGYSGNSHRAAQGSRSFPYTDSPRDIHQAFAALYRAKVQPGLPIRTLNLSVNGLRPSHDVIFQENLFGNPEKDWRDRRIEKTLGLVQHRFGRNALLKGIDYMPGANRRMRNALIGGHRA